MKKKTMGLVLIGALFISKIAFTEPGSSTDPLVTRSYVDGKIKDLKDYFSKEIDKEVVGETSNLEIVNLKKGQVLVCDGGTEIILRGGKATAYGVVEDRGIADVTKGEDIDNITSYIPYNHLLLVPRSDGRGAYAIEDAIFMVRGSYIIK